MKQDTMEIENSSVVREYKKITKQVHNTLSMSKATELTKPTVSASESEKKLII